MGRSEDDLRKRRVWSNTYYQRHRSKIQAKSKTPEALQRRRERWHRTKDKFRDKRIEAQRKWYARTKESRRSKIREYSYRTYWKNRDKKLAKNWIYRLKNRTRLLARARVLELKRDWGLTPEQYDALLNQQNGVCAICKKVCSSGRRLAVDHIHGTKTIRGLLCGKCNAGIGHFKDSPDLMRSAIDYLNKHQPAPFMAYEALSKSMEAQAEDDKEETESNDIVP